MSNFCEECGGHLTPSCVSCGHQISPTAKFCSQCGRPVGATADDAHNTLAASAAVPGPADRRARAEIEEGRKHVTVLFADIKDSIDLITTYDAEIVSRAFLRPLLDLMIDAIRSHGGTLTSVRGDGVMAVFGVPRALEDHAVRACSTGLQMQGAVTRYAQELQRSHGVSLTIRVGIASGEVIGNIVGDALHTDYNFVGPTAWLASRLEQMAAPGSVFTTADTLRLAEGYVAMRPAGLMPVQGAGPSHRGLRGDRGCCREDPAGDLCVARPDALRRSRPRTRAIAARASARGRRQRAGGRNRRRSRARASRA